MAFKMKGPSTHRGTERHRQELKFNRTMDNTSLPDGRAGSSPFQLSDDKDKKPKKTVTTKWDPEVTTKKRNVEGGHDTETTQKGTKTTYQPPSKTPAGDDAYKKLSPGDRKKQDDKYIAANTKVDPLARSKSSSTRAKLEPIPSLPPKQVKSVDTPKVEPIKAKETKRQKIDRKKKEREDKRSYTVEKESSTFKRKVIKDKETGRERKVGRSGFGKLVSKVTGRDTVKRSRRPKKRRKNNCVGNLCSAVDGGIKTAMNPKKRR